MSQTVQFVDFKQLLAQQGDASSLSEAELGRLKKQYEKLRKEWARKRRKLEKLDRAARAKQHVRRKLQEQQLQTGGAADTTSPIQQQHCGRDGGPPVIQDQLFPGGCPRDGDNGDEPIREGKFVHHQEEDQTAVDFTCGKSVSFSLDIASAYENTQHEHPAKFEICKLSTVPTSEENALKSTDKLKVCNVSKAKNVTKQSTRQDSSKSNSYSFATFPGSHENSMQSTNSTSDKCDSNDSTVQEEEVSIVQESSATLGLGNASACIREELGEIEYDRNGSEQDQHTVPHFGDGVQDTRNRKPLFKGSFRQTIPNENLDETARHNEQKISIQPQGEDLNTTKENSPRNNSTYSALDLSVDETEGLNEQKISIQTQGEDLRARNSSPNSDLDLSVEYVDDNLSECRVPESSYCEGPMPGHQNQLPLANTTIVLDSEEDEAECVDELHLPHDIHAKSQIRQKENTGIGSAERKGKPTSLNTLPQRNITESCPGQEMLEEGNYDNKKVAKNSVELSSGQEYLHEEDILPKNQTKQKENLGIMSTKTKTNKPSSLNLLSPRNLTELSPGQEMLEEENDCNKKTAKNSVESSSGQEDVHEEDNSQIVEPSQGNVNKNTWIDGLMFPAEYYVRTTRRMQRQGLTPDGIARQVKARTQRKQKRKVDSNDDGALEATGVKKQANLDVAGTSAAKQAKLDVAGTSAAKQAKLDVAGTSAAKQAKLDVAGNSAAKQAKLDVAGTSAAKKAKLDVAGTSAAKQAKLDVAGTSAAKQAKLDVAGTSAAKQAKLDVAGTSAAKQAKLDVAGTSAAKQAKLDVAGNSAAKKAKLDVAGTSAAISSGFEVGKSSALALPKEDGKSTMQKLSPVANATLFENMRNSCGTHRSFKTSTEGSATYPLQDFNKGLPKDLICEGVAQDKLQVLRKGRKASSTHNTPVQTSGLRRLVKGRKKTKSCQNSPVQSGCSSVLVEENVQDCSQVVEGDVLCRRSERSCQNSPVQTECSSVLTGVEESIQDCSQVVETRSCQNSRSPILSGCLNILEGGEESLKDCSQVVEVQRLVKGRKTTKARSCQNSPVQSGCSGVFKGVEESLQDCSQVVEGDVLCRRSKRLKNRYSQEAQISRSQEQKALKEIRALQAQPESAFCKGSQEALNSTSQEQTALKGVQALKAQTESEFLKGYQNSKKEEAQISSSQEQTALKEVRALTPQPESELCKGNQKSEKETRRFFPILSDQLTEKLRNCKASEFHLPYSDYGTLKVAKAREAPSADVSKKCSSSSSTGMDAKDVGMPSKDSSVNYMNENQALLVGAESLRRLRSNKNLDDTSSLSCKGNSFNLASKTKDARMPSNSMEVSVKNKKEDQPLPISAESLSPLRSNKNLDDTSTLSSCKENFPNLASNTELGQDKSRNLFPSLSPMLHKKCTEAVLDFSLVGTEYVKLKLNKVKSSPQPATATSSCHRNSRHGKGRHPVSKAKGNLQASSTNSKNLAKETSVKQSCEVTAVQNRQQQNMHDVIQEKASKMPKEDNLLPNSNENEFAATTSPDASVQPSLGSEVRVSDSGIQAPSKAEEDGQSAMSCSSPDLEDQNAFSGVDRNKMGTMCENRKLPVTASTKPLEPQNLVVSKSPCSKAIEMTPLENNEVRICESQASQDIAALVDNGSTDREVPCSDYAEPISQKMADTEISPLENSDMHNCKSQASQDISVLVNERKTNREIPCSDYTEPISQKMEDTDMNRCVKVTSDCFYGRISESERFLSATSVEDGDEREAEQTPGVEEIGEEGVATRVTDLSRYLKPTREAVVSVALCEARIHEEHAAVLAVCQNTAVSLWVQQGEDWAPGASWEIPKHEEVCDLFLLPCEVGVQVMVGGNFTTGFLKFFNYDGVSTSSQNHSWDEGVALVGDGFHGDGCHGDSYHAMAVLPQAVAIATGPSDGGSSVCKVTMSSTAGHVEQQTRLPVPAGLRIGSLQQVEGCAGCLMGTGDNQVLLWNHTAGVLLRCVDLPGAYPTCLYAASAQGLLFAVVCSPQYQDRCSLVAINPRTGRSLSLQKYQLPHGSSLARCTNGVMDGPRLLVIQDNGGLYLWDFFSGEMETVLPGVSKKSFSVTVGKGPL